MLREQLPLVQAMLAGGATRKEIAEAIGVSAPAVTQFVSREPSLRRYRARGTLTRQRDQLLALRREVHHLAGEIRQMIRELNEELEADAIDRLLRLR